MIKILTADLSAVVRTIEKQIFSSCPDFEFISSKLLYERREQFCIQEFANPQKEKKVGVSRVLILSKCCQFLLQCRKMSRCREKDKNKRELDAKKNE